MLICCFKDVIVFVLFLHYNFTSLSPLILIYVFFSHVNTVSVYAGLKTNRGGLFLFAWGFSLISGAQSIHALVLCKARSVGKYLLLSQSSTSDWWTSVFRHLRYLTSWWDDCQCMFDTGFYESPAGWSSNWWHTVGWFHRLIFFRSHTSSSPLWVHLSNKSLVLKNLLFLGLLLWESKVRHLKIYRFINLYPKDL